MSKEPHAITRARERYGLELTAADLDEIGRTCRQDGMLIANQADGGSIWVVKVKAVLCRIVLSKSGYVRTFLDLNARLTKARMS